MLRWFKRLFERRSKPAVHHRCHTCGLLFPVKYMLQGFCSTLCYVAYIKEVKNADNAK